MRWPLPLTTDFAPLSSDSHVILHEHNMIAKLTFSLALVGAANGKFATVASDILPMVHISRLQLHFSPRMYSVCR